MARTFTQKHYIAAADTIIAAYLAPDHIGTRLAPDASGKLAQAVALGVGKVRAQFIATFTADSEKFDCDKFHRYIETRVQRARNIAEQAEPWQSFEDRQARYHAAHCEQRHIHSGDGTPEGCKQ